MIDSLMASNELVLSQWAEMLRRRVETRNSAFSGVSSLQPGKISGRRVKVSAPKRKSFFAKPDAGKPLSLRFLCEAIELDLGAVQEMARARIAPV